MVTQQTEEYLAQHATCAQWARTASAMVGLMINGAEPGMLKLIESVPLLALAAVMASRKLQWVTSQTPSDTSSVVLTM